MIYLGDKVKDKVTGFTGIATSEVYYLNGCKQIGITPEVGKDGKFPETTYVDSQQVVLFSKKKVKVKVKKTGGHRSDAPKY